MWAELGGLVTAVSYAGGDLSVRAGMKGSNPLAAAIATLTINVILLWSISFILVPWDAFRLSLVWIFIVDGIMTQTFGRLLKFTSIARLGAARTGVIMGATPLFSVSLAVLLLKERITAPVLGGAIFIVLGIALITEQREEGQGRFKDIIFPVISALLFGFSPIIRKWGISGLGHPFLGAAVTASTSLVTLLILSYFFPGRGGLVLTGRSLRYFVFSGLATTVALPLFYYALMWGPVIVVGPLSNTAGFFIVLISHLFLRSTERITSRVWGGCLAVLAGATLIILH